MDLSTDIGNLHEQIKAENSRSGEDSASMQDLSEILDLSGLDLDNEETWYEFNFNWHQKLILLLF